jgi:DNA-directed RNA polymerase subunit RPC12/RpoP
VYIKQRGGRFQRGPPSIAATHIGTRRRTRKSLYGDIEIDLNLIPFGLRESDNLLVDISDVRRGRGCGCICPSCKTPLIARHGQINEWHFAHASRNVYSRTEEECTYSFFVSVRLMARQIVDELLEIKLPSLIDKIEEHNEILDLDIATQFVVTDEKTVSIEDVSKEREFSKVTVDILGKIKGYPFAIFFSHPGRTAPRGLTNPTNPKSGVISISLDKVGLLFSSREKAKNSYKSTLLKYIQSDLPSKQWLFHPRYKRAKSEAAVIQKVKVQRALEIEKEKHYRLNETTRHEITSKSPIQQSGSDKIDRKVAVNYKCLNCQSQIWTGYLDDGTKCKKCGSHLYKQVIAYL